MKTFEIPKHTLIHYIRKGKRVPYGVIVAVKLPDGDVSIDYAICRKNDRFTKAMALEIAIGRAMNFKSIAVHYQRALPHSVAKVIDKFNQRASKYYRTSVDDMITW